MSTIKKVFLIIGTLVIIFLAWQLIFNDGGIIKTGYDAVATAINTQYEKVAGDGAEILPAWGSHEDNGSASDLDIE